MRDPILEKLNEILGTNIVLPANCRFDIGDVGRDSVNLLVQGDNALLLERISRHGEGDVVRLNVSKKYKLVVKNEYGDNVIVELDLCNLHKEALIEKRKVTTHKSVLDLIADTRRLICPYHDITRTDIIEFFKGTKIADLLTDDFWADPVTQKAIYEMNIFDHEPVMDTALYINLLISEVLKLPAANYQRFLRSIITSQHHYGRPKPRLVRLKVTDANAKPLLDELGEPKVIELTLYDLYPTARPDVEGFLEQIPEGTYITSDTGYPFKLK